MLLEGRCPFVPARVSGKKGSRWKGLFCFPCLACWRESGLICRRTFQVSLMRPTTNCRTTQRLTPLHPAPPQRTQPNPIQPNPTQPNPTQPNPTQPNPTQPNPTQPNPTQPILPITSSTFGGIFLFVASCVSRLGYDLEGKCKAIATRRRSSGGGARSRSPAGGKEAVAGNGNQGRSATAAAAAAAAGAAGTTSSDRSSPNYTSESVIVDIYGGVGGGGGGSGERSKRASRRSASSVSFFGGLGREGVVCRVDGGSGVALVLEGGGGFTRYINCVGAQVAEARVSRACLLCISDAGVTCGSVVFRVPTSRVNCCVRSPLTPPYMHTVSRLPLASCLLPPSLPPPAPAFCTPTHRTPLHSTPPHPTPLHPRTESLCS